MTLDLSLVETEALITELRRRSDAVIIGLYSKSAQPPAPLYRWRMEGRPEDRLLLLALLRLKQERHFQAQLYDQPLGGESE